MSSEQSSFSLRTHVSHSLAHVLLLLTRLLFSSLGPRPPLPHRGKRERLLRGREKEREEGTFEGTLRANARRRRREGDLKEEKQRRTEDEEKEQTSMKHPHEQTSEGSERASVGKN